MLWFLQHSTKLAVLRKFNNLFLYFLQQSNLLYLFWYFLQHSPLLCITGQIFSAKKYPIAGAPIENHFLLIKLMVELPDTASGSELPS